MFFLKKNKAIDQIWKRWLDKRETQTQRFANIII